MAKMTTWLLALILGALGGWLPLRFGLFASFMGGLVGTALGVWLGRKLAQHYGA